MHFHLDRTREEVDRLQKAVATLSSLSNDHSVIGHVLEELLLFFFL